MSTQPESPQPLHETNVSATTPLLESTGDGGAKVETAASPLVVTVSTGGGGGGGGGAANSPAKAPSSPSKQAPAATATATATAQPQERPVSQSVNEYRFVHLRIPPRSGKRRFLLPTLLLVFQLVFIILFAFFANYSPESNTAPNKYPMFVDLHAIAILGFGFIMTFLKRYGYGSIGFNLLLVAFVIQWALIVRGWLGWGKQSNLNFNVGIENLVFADFTAIAVLVSFGAVLGTVTLTQLVVIAIIEVVAQVFNEYLNIHIIKTYDVGRSVYVHLFGAIFGRAVSKFLHFKGVSSTKQASVYHSDLFALIGTLFLFVYYPSFNGLLAHSLTSQTKAIVNTLAAICASCVATFGISSLAGCGRINVLHVQHATIAGGIAIGSVVDLNVQIYVALIVGAVAGFLSTIGYQYIEPFAHRVLKIHDTCSVVSLHGLPGLIAALLGAIFAACATFEEYRLDLYTIYPARLPAESSNDYNAQKLTGAGGLGRTGFEQAGFQLIGLVITAGIALVTGALTGLFLRLPIFEQLSEDVEMFDDEAQWLTPDDYALKLTFAATTNQTQAAPAAPAEPAPQSPTEAKKEDSKV